MNREKWRALPMEEKARVLVDKFREIQDLIQVDLEKNCLIFADRRIAMDGSFSYPLRMLDKALTVVTKPRSEET